VWTVVFAFFPQGPLAGTIASLIASPRSYLVEYARAPVHEIYEIDQRKVPR